MAEDGAEDAGVEAAPVAGADDGFGIVLIGDAKAR
jgi:hypothetical protein